MTDLQNIYDLANNFKVFNLCWAMNNYCEKTEPSTLTLKFKILLTNRRNGTLSSNDFCNAVFMVLHEIPFTHPIDLDEAMKEGHKAPPDSQKPTSNCS